MHTEDAGLATTGDPHILSWCCAQDRLLATADKKLTKFLASSRGDCPSVLITREMRTMPAEQVAAILIANLPQQVSYELHWPVQSMGRPRVDIDDKDALHRVLDADLDV